MTARSRPANKGNQTNASKFTRRCSLCWLSSLVFVRSCMRDQELEWHFLLWRKRLQPFSNEAERCIKMLLLGSGRTNTFLIFGWTLIYVPQLAWFLFQTDHSSLRWSRYPLAGFTHLWGYRDEFSGIIPVSSWCFLKPLSKSYLEVTAKGSVPEIQTLDRWQAEVLIIEPSLCLNFQVRSVFCCSINILINLSIIAQKL